MSYEGHVQCVCENGHYFERDCHDEDGACDECRAPAAWTNGVDDTNCDSVGAIPHDLFEAAFLVSPAQWKVCNLGHTHETNPPVYRIPTESEAAPLRRYLHDHVWKKFT